MQPGQYGGAGWKNVWKRNAYLW